MRENKVWVVEGAPEDSPEVPRYRITIRIDGEHYVLSVDADDTLGEFRSKLADLHNQIKFAGKMPRKKKQRSLE